MLEVSVGAGDKDERLARGTSAKDMGRRHTQPNPKGHPRRPPFQTIVDKYKYKNAAPPPPISFLFRFSDFPHPLFFGKC